MDKKHLKWIAPAIVVVVAVIAGRTIIANKPEARKFEAPEMPATVEAVRVNPVPYQVIVRSEGTVEPRTESTLIPQVAGQVRSVSASFREGGFFGKGDVLVTLDPTDYELATATAAAQVAQAESALQLELAQAEVVKNDWKMLGKEAPKLGLREPQITAARAALQSAKAQLERARTDLSRTRIRAPYAGQLLEKNVDIGQYVSPGTVLARIYATDVAEVRLPLSTRQLEFVDLPGPYAEGEGRPDEQGPPVSLMADIGRTTWRWDGVVVRAEGAIDTRSRQLYVVAQVDQPYARGPEGRPPLRIGQFVRAEIKGRRLPDTFVLPRAALREGDEVLVIDDESRLQRRTVDVAWADDDQAVIVDGLQAGEIVNVTPLAVASSGAKVAAIVDGVQPAPRRAAKDRPPEAQASGNGAGAP